MLEKLILERIHSVEKELLDSQRWTISMLQADNTMFKMLLGEVEGLRTKVIALEAKLENAHA